MRNWASLPILKQEMKHRCPILHLTCGRNVI